MPITNPYAKTNAPTLTSQPLIHNRQSPPSKLSSAHAVSSVDKIVKCPTSARTKKVSFKAQLKQQLHDLKRKKKLEADLKIAELQLKKREAERRRVEEEQKRIRHEYEMKQEEKKRLKEAERLAEAERKRERDEQKSLARRAAEIQQLANEEFQQNAARRMEMEYHQHHIGPQQRQPMLYGSLSNHICFMDSDNPPTMATPMAYCGAKVINQYRMTPAPIPRRPPPKILSENPLQYPSPFAEDYEILPHLIIIVKERKKGSSFGVSVEALTQSVLVDKDVKELLKKKPTTEKMTIDVPCIGVDGSGRSAPTTSTAIQSEMSSSDCVQSTNDSKSLPDVVEKPRSCEESGKPGDSILKNFEPVPLKPIAAMHTETIPKKLKIESQEGQKILPSRVDDCKDGAESSQEVRPMTSDLVRPCKSSDADLLIEIAGVKKRKRKRRKREFFHVMRVMDASVQNAMLTMRDENKKLKAGDLILEIRKVSISGLHFFQACQLFASCDGMESLITEDASMSDNMEDLIECPLLVARRKPRAPKMTVPLLKHHIAAHTTISIKPAVNNSGDFSVDETLELASLVAKVSTNPECITGYEPPIEVWKQCMTSFSLLLGRDLSSIQRKLLSMQNSLDAKTKIAFDKYWKREWDSEEAIFIIPQLPAKGYLSLSELASARSLPRPFRGCRCGASDHEYVDNPRCILYFGLRKLLGDPLSNPPHKKVDLDTTSMQEMSAVEAAFKDRFVKMKQDRVNEIAEARFVDKMEKFQVETLKRAIFPPNFPTMVLCAVAAVSLECNPSPESGRKNRLVDDVIAHSFEPDDDDMPLQSLSKHLSAEDDGSPFSKKGRNEVNEMPLLGFCPTFLKQVLSFISHTWGHVYQEPTHGDFSWRWEVHHGQTSNVRRQERATCKNARIPGTLTFEHIEFALKETSFSNTEEGSQRTSKSVAEDIIHLSYLLSPKKTGLLDELKALTHLSIIVQKSEQGAAFLADDWYSRVDPLILDDMHSKWSLSADPDNKYLIHPKVKQELTNYWIRVEEDNAWALKDDPSDIIFVDEEWDEWRRSFEADWAIAVDDEDGIGKFGI